MTVGEGVRRDAAARAIVNEFPDELCTAVAATRAIDLISLALARAHAEGLEAAARLFVGMAVGPRGGECHFAASDIVRRIRALNGGALPNGDTAAELRSLIPAAPEVPSAEEGEK